ncbi:MFS general substrate transporter [Dothidotthia symphoricarpi CBS 119687]|uniref:MFS general substrate transporter n=1 Tax=Dothidotthia symphoricarpi CBS 119687 TaxID=1392245 RepID=A0A6A6A6B7_9PLEO|nr:MFS general substrate transporter [Dothidotthia symphoricarpi CBS 119687]KAF2127380.1 MFS general substrate transporter [Dothidotthia symphoricarpi CBS 119687]
MSGQAETTLPTTPPYPSAAKTAVIMISLYISIFLVALDRTIMGPAIPAITNQFNSMSDIGWYGSAYMLTSSGFILLYGRVYTFFPTKPVFLSGILLFEIGSAICGAAQTSMVLIIGRAVAGLGSSGIFTGAILIMLNTVPLHRRPMLQGLFGACFGVASVAGPLLGGAFTGSKLTWRWCFYINLPLGGITILVVMLLLKLEEEKPKLNNWKDTVRHLDPLGTVLFLPAITCLLLALEWGAAEYSWNSPRLIALLVVFAVLFMGFGVWQYLTRNTTATVPARILLQRSVAFGGASQFCVGATMLTISIYIPLWFQAIKGTTAMQSGINTIPLVLSVVVGSILSGGLVQRIGYYTPFMILGSSLMATGTGLITTWNMNTSSFGVGCTMQHPNLAVQVILQRQDVPIGTAILSLCQTLGGAVFAAVGQNLYIDKFSDSLQRIKGLDSHGILDAGATELTKSVPPALRLQVLEAYNNSLTKGTFFAALIVACFAVPAALGMEWRSVKEKQQPSATQDEEKIESIAQQRLNDVALTRTTTQPSMTQESEPSLLAPPPAVWRRMYRSSGQFSEWMTAKVNPDLRGNLPRARR